MVDMSEFVAPKSNQLNADDLLPGPRTIRITRVSGTGNGEQPVAVSFEGDDGKPFLPCKSMRRVMIAAWGADASQYAGRSMTLYRDPKVKWGGMEVGGIRISHMSHIEREMVMALTVTKKERAPYRVKPLVIEAPKPATDAALDAAQNIIARVKGAHDAETLQEVTADPKVVKLRARLREARPELADQVDAAVTAQLELVEIA
ncbi:MAG TPA: hypothetical protein VGN96_01160 [Roseococcus sp.]|jgi:hypothetical protein|nr:hypothetical protein [Roseococcus sp.]